MAQIWSRREYRFSSVLSDPHLRTLRPLRGKVVFFEHYRRRNRDDRRERRMLTRAARLRGAKVQDTWDPDAPGNIHTHYRVVTDDLIPQRKADRHPGWRYITSMEFEDFIANCDAQATAFTAVARRVPHFLPRPRSEMVQLMMFNTPESLALCKLRRKSRSVFRMTRPVLGWLYLQGQTGYRFGWDL